jgi:hypothetical protein
MIYAIEMPINFHEFYKRSSNVKIMAQKFDGL